MPSERNVELHRRFVEAFNMRDLEAMIAYCDPSIEFHSTFAAVGGAVYHGHDGMRSWHRDLAEAWGEGIRIEPEAYFDLGEDTLAFHILHGRGQHSGADVAVPGAGLLRWRDGLIVYLKAYTYREDVLSDLGVCEEELEPNRDERV
jgi:ketosteroid isomerase-like protein